MAVRRLLATMGTTVATVSLVVALAAPSSAAADSGAEADFVARVNAARAAAGLGPLAVAGDLVDVARAHSGTMAAKNTLFHNPSLADAVADWLEVGENVGVGGDVAAIHDAFMASPAHRANILDASYTQVGIGVVSAGGRIWVTEVFRTPASAPAPAAPAPAPTTPPPPPPAPAPAPAAAAVAAAVAAPAPAVTAAPAPPTTAAVPVTTAAAPTTTSTTAARSEAARASGHDGAVAATGARDDGTGTSASAEVVRLDPRPAGRTAAAAPATPVDSDPRDGAAVAAAALLAAIAFTLARLHRHAVR